MDIPLGIGVAIVGGMSAYWVNRLVDRDRQNKAEKELRDWVDSKYVAREVLQSKLEALHARVKDMDVRITRMHRENSGKLDHLLGIVSSLSGLRGTTVQPVKPRRIDDEEIEHEELP